MSTSAFGVEDSRISKADGEKKDRKALKYTGAATGGLVVGSRTGSRIALKRAGTTLEEVERRTDEAILNARRHPETGHIRAIYRVPKSVLRSVPGHGVAWKGSRIGMAVGTAGGVGLYGAHRANKNRTKS